MLEDAVEGLSKRFPNSVVSEDFLSFTSKSGKLIFSGWLVASSDPVGGDSWGEIV